MGRCPLMSLLHRYPDAAALETRDEGLRREVLEEPPKLERWDLVESRWNLGSVLVVLAGAALAVLGWVAAARTGLNETWYRPSRRWPACATPRCWRRLRPVAAWCW
jgi:hypothetical protein